MRDYELWHTEYDDPQSSHSWRLEATRACIAQFLDTRTGPLRVVSACSGDGRDLLGVLADRDDGDRMIGALLELHPTLAQRAREAAQPWPGIEVHTVDAGVTDSYAGLVPADLVLLVGIFGNISAADLDRTVDTAPQFCAPGALLIWSRSLKDGNRNDEIRARFVGRGFTELDYATYGEPDKPTLGAMRYDGEPQPLAVGQKLFTFLR